ncbi:hypothetical protein MTP10_03740 [Nonomuraea sp. 3-1Str]|uniref:hypothetical protein n=1 Tax=Nonomuraea sp. 3-1Str TaxID=2929801 RepID=UPI002866681B|nr:hypothetical protein [Nonomuraea sp. 3-1Str]MDR8407847.1 hypothetical protein [Nonomuraea sp. 3-1Str]
MNISRPGAFAAAVLLLDALVHLFWLIRPVADPRALSLAVLDVEVPFTARVLVPLVLLLSLAALSVAAASGGRGGWVARAVTLAVGAGALVRGELGLAWAFGLGTDTASAFYRLNLFLYTPVCLATALAVGVVLVRARPGLVRARPGLVGARPGRHDR